MNPARTGKSLAEKDSLSSRERLLAALNHREPDRVPVMFWGAIAPLRHLWKTPFERVKVLRDLGVDDQLSVGHPWPHHPDVKVKLSRDDSHPDYPRLVKEFETPKGALRMAIKKTPDYPWDNPPLMSDHNWSRATEFLIKGPEDLDRLRYILYEPRTDSVRGEPPREGLMSFRDSVRQVKEFSQAEHVLLAGSAPSPVNVAMNLLGATHMMMYSVDNRPFLKELLALILSWSKRRLQVVLDVGVDTLQFSGVYESTAFWSPKDFDDLFAPGVKQIADMIHQAGAKFHYFSDALIMDQLERFRDLGVDALSYLNPPPQGDVIRINNFVRCVRGK